ncbi:hypothetical protein I4U23_015611 [Adineta vaga]|nr:hypothetical protein I4U23_015611 [Adineta vaga]
MASSGTHNFHLVGLLPKWHPYFDRHDVNLTSYQLLWTDIKLSELEDEEEIFSTLTKFREVVNYTKAFDHWRYCLKHIEKCHDVFTFLVCSVRYAQDIIPELLPFRKTNIWKVYIYGKSKVLDTRTLEFIAANKKVCSIHTERDDLLKKIKEDVQEYFKHEKAGIFSEQNPRHQISIDDNFELWWHNIIKVLISLPYPENYHHRLVAELKNHGFTDAIIDEFKIDFPSKKRAVSWYSGSSIFFGILNQALRQRNIKVLLLFGSFLQDLYRELKQEQEKYTARSIVKLYRGQVFSDKDLEKLAAGCSIQNNALFSTSSDCSIAKGFLIASECEQGANRVLFEIETDYRHLTAVFADITSLSFFPEERETLFMVNTRFVLHSIQERNDLHELPPYWLVKLKLQSHYDIFRDTQLEAGSERKTLKNCLSALRDMSELIATLEDTIVFDILMNIYPREAKWIKAVKLYALAELEAQHCDDPTEKKHDYSSSFSYYEQALAIWEEYSAVDDDDDKLNCSFDIAENYFARAQLYECGPPHLSDFSVDFLKKAARFYELALKKCSTNDYEKMEIVPKLSRVYKDLTRTDRDKYGLKSIEYQHLWIELVKDHPIPSKSQDLAWNYENLADRYAVLYHYEDAMIHYKKALEFYPLNNMQADLLDRMMDLYRKIVTIYMEHMHDFKSALHYELLRHECCQKLFAENNSTPNRFSMRSIEESHFSVADCYLNMKQYILAYKHLYQGLAYVQQRKYLILRDVRLVIKDGRLVYASNERPLQEPCKSDDKELEDCNCIIKEKEQKLKYAETLLEN